jgi:hypothetical protein
MIGADQIELVSCDVDTDQAVSVASQAGQGDGSYITQTEDTDVHERS